MLHPRPPSPPGDRQPRAQRYGVALGATAVALLLSVLLRPLVAPNPFLFFVGAIAVSAWYGGLGPGLLTTGIAVVTVNFLFFAPTLSFKLLPLDALRLAAFAVIAVLISSLSGSRRSAERAAQAQREQLQVTLASIGDAVIATDTAGRVSFLNGVAAALTGWEPEAARGQPIERVFRVVDAASRQPVESPVARVLREGAVVGLANHTLLVARDGVERPIDDSGAPIRDGGGALVGVVLVFRDITERQRAEAARAELLAREQAARAEAEAGRERATYLADASRLLAGSLDYQATLRQVADLAVPRVADWCVVDLLDRDGAIQMVATAHVDPAKVAWAEQLRRDYPVDPDGPAGTPYVVRTGESQLFPDIPDAMLEAVARSPEELRILRTIGYRSIMVVPLRAGGRVLGALSLVSAESERRYGPDDLAFAQELADRAAVAIENARLYLAAQEELARRQQAEAALGASEAQLRLIADALPVLISYLDREQHYRFNNRAYEQWFGTARADVTGRHIRDVVGEAAYAGLRPRLEAALAGETVSFESLTPYRSGGTRHIHATYVPDRGEDGAVRGVVVLVEDVTARKRAEEGQRMLVAAGMSLATSLDLEETLMRVARLTIPTLADYTVIYVAGEDGRIARFASAHRDPAREPLLARLEREHPLDPGSDIPVARVLRSGEPIVGEAADQVPPDIAQDAGHLRLLGELGPQAFMALPMRARGRTLGALLCVATSPERRYTRADLSLAEELATRAALAIDNTALYRATERARDAAEEAIRLRDLFLSVASHELKTPLTSLLLQVQLLQRRIARDNLLAERERRTLAVVAEQAQRLDRLVAALLDISRLELGQLSLNVARVDLCDMARRVVAEVQPTSEEHRVTCTAPATPLIVAGDELRLEQVLQNLVQNAIKYSPAGGPVEVEVAADGDQVSLAVSDRGIGLPEEALAHVFERFYRASNADPRQISGMGIGLYVVKEIVRLHGGSVQAAGREGGGSRFSVRLPLAPAGAELPAQGADGVAMG